MRYPFALSGGVCVAILLFFLMDGLIAGSPERIVSDAERFDTTYVRVPQEDLVNTKVRTKPQPPEPPETPPPPPQLPTANPSEPVRQLPDIQMPRIAADGVGIGPWLPRTGEPGPANQELVAVVRISPEYPRRASLDGTEGWVDLALTVAADGSVTTASVIDSHPARVFDREALRAIYRWKFKAQRVNGVATSRKAIMRMEFSL